MEHVSLQSLTHQPEQIRVFNEPSIVSGRVGGCRGVCYLGLGCLAGDWEYQIPHPLRGGATYSRGKIYNDGA